MQVRSAQNHHFGLAEPFQDKKIKPKYVYSCLVRLKWLKSDRFGCSEVTGLGAVARWRRSGGCCVLAIFLFLCPKYGSDLSE
jgi:hypothetical protein